MPRVSRGIAAALVIGAGALAARQALRAISTSVPEEPLRRINFRGRTVSLSGGPALAIGASLAAAAGAGSAPAAGAALVAGLGSGAVGAYDDIVGARPTQSTAKGFTGHLRALANGQVTTGLAKIAGVGLSALAAAALLAADDRRRKPRSVTGKAIDVALGAGVIAGTANLVNLLDLRPGRAIKAGLLLGTPLALATAPTGGIAAGAVGASAALLPADLSEEIMLGDAGANALGALVGTALAARTGPVARAGLLAGIVALTAASEKVSFTQVIARTPVLRELDALGRRSD